MLHTQFNEPVAFVTLTPEEIATLSPVPWMIIGDVTGQLSVYHDGIWAGVPLFTGTRHDGDVLTWKTGQDIWVPASDVNIIGTLTGQSARFNQDSATALEVRRTWKTLVATKVGSGDMKPWGDHLLTADTSYQVVIDGAGDERNATFKWSNDGGATYQQLLQPVTDIARIPLEVGVFVQFLSGTYELSDQWTFTAIASANQLYDLLVDTTSSIVKVGTTLQIANDATFTLNESGAPVNQNINFTGLARLYYQENAGERTLAYTNNSLAILTIKTPATAANRYIGLFNAPVQFNATATPTTPAATFADLYQKADKPYWLDSAGVESIIPQAAKAETISGAWTFSAAGTALTVTNNATISGTLTVSTIAATTISGAVTASGAWTFSAAGTAIAVTNNVTIGGTLGVTGVTTVGTINITAGTATAYTITTLTSTTATITTATITTLTTPTIKDTGGTTRIALSTISTHVNLTGDVGVTGTLTANVGFVDGFAGGLSVLPGIYDAILGTKRIALSTSSPHITLTGHIKLATASATIMDSGGAVQITVATTGVTIPTLLGAVTASGAWTFSAAGTALAVTNNATVGGTLGVTGVTTVGTINITAGTATAYTITTLTAPTIAGATTASGAWTFSAAGTALTVTNNLLVSGNITSPIVYGSSASGGGLTIGSTSHATKGTVTLGTSGYDEVNNRLGIGTLVPGAANAYGKFHIDGTVSNAAGPHFKTTALATDAYSMLHFLSFSHNNIFVGFDMYYDGSFRASDATTSFSIYKNAGMKFNYANASTAGTAITQVTALLIQTDGNISIGTTSSYGGGKGVVNIFNAPTAPSTNPTGGGILYVVAGALTWRGSSGTVTTIAAA